MRERIRSGVWGLAVGDALGVPFEFSNRLTLAADPVTELMGGLMYRQPVGTFSDDTSMTLCLLDSLCGGYSPEDVMRRFVDWYYNGAYTATDVVFDVGRTCSHAISRYQKRHAPLFECADASENSNGNGALMRILPLLFYLENKFGVDFLRSGDARTRIREITCLTHGHPRCTVANGIYLSVAAKLAGGRSPAEAVRDGVAEAFSVYERESECAAELPYFERLREPRQFSQLDDTEISSYGYVVNTLEAAVWCLLTTQSYAECVLKAVNLGCDTDTNAAVAGGLAGLCYGIDRIPGRWRARIKKKELIDALCDHLADSLASGQSAEPPR